LLRCSCVIPYLFWIIKKKTLILTPRSGVADSDADFRALSTLYSSLNNIIAFLWAICYFQNFRDIYASHVLIFFVDTSNVSQKN
jgi:hypothetical protein